MNATTFWDWFRKNESTLKHGDGQTVAKSLEEKLSHIHPKLGVEVADEEKFREVIITAGGDPSVFHVVEELAHCGPTVEGWRFYPLKPPMGFDFVIAFAGKQLAASELTFEPLQSSKEPDKIGIRVVVPDLSSSEQMTDMMWMIIQTGIGEKAASQISFLDVSNVGSEDGKLLPIATLDEYVKWHVARAKKKPV